MWVIYNIVIFIGQHMTQEQLNEELIGAILVEDIPAGAQAALDKGADINAKSLKGSGGLMLALSRNKRKSFAFLIKKGVDVDAQDNLGESILMRLSRDDKRDYLTYLLDNGNPNLNLKNTLGVSALHYACMYSNEECAKMLLEKGADVHIKTIQNSTPILAAAQNHNKAIVEELIKRGANVHDLDYAKKNVLMNLVSNPAQTMKPEELESMTAITTMLVDNQVDVNYKAPTGLTAIFAATMYGQKAVVKQLLDAGASPDVTHNIMTNSKISPLHITMEMGDAETAGFILEKVASQETAMNTPNSEGNTPASYGYFHANTRQLTLDNKGDVNAVLHVQDQKIPVIAHIIQSGDEATFDAMVTRGVNLHFTDEEFKMLQPLKLAISIGLPNMVEKVIKNGKLDLNEPFHVTDTVKVTPLAFLVANSQAQNLETFLARKKTIQALLNQKLGDGSDAHRLPEETRQSLQAELDKYKNIETELAQNKSIVLDLLIDNGADINAKDQSGRSALFYVADVEYVDILMQKGADFFQLDDEGNNPLTWAIKNNKTHLIDKYLEYVVDGEHIDKIQDILLDIAYTGSEGYHTQGLMMAGLNHAVQEGSSLLNVQDEEGNTPLIVTCATGQSPVAALLISKGADVNMTNNEGETALMHAVAHGDAQTVDLLIAKGANTSAETNAGKTVMDFAEEVQNKDIMQMVQKKSKLSM